MKKQTILLILLLAGFLFLLAPKVRAESALADYKAGLALYQKCQYEKALEHFQWAMDDDFNFWQSYQMAGYCYFYLREKENALNAFEESLRLKPNNPPLRKFYASLKTGKTGGLLQPVIMESKAVPADTPFNLGLN